MKEEELEKERIKEENEKEEARLRIENQERMVLFRNQGLISKNQLCVQEMEKVHRKKNILKLSQYQKSI